ncbi:MAG: hypothetical protein DLM58_14005 [Pseudonocardiales bacterium]|nr:MAG: hypothetical protein DLM58_14005 [Pseudonocardiales bacterium]
MSGGDRTGQQVGEQPVRAPAGDAHRACVRDRHGRPLAPRGTAEDRSGQVVESEGVDAQDREDRDPSR